MGMVTSATANWTKWLLDAKVSLDSRLDKLEFLQRLSIFRQLRRTSLDHLDTFPDQLSLLKHFDFLIVKVGVAIHDFEESPVLIVRFYQGPHPIGELMSSRGPGTLLLALGTLLSLISILHHFLMCYQEKLLGMKIRLTLKLIIALLFVGSSLRQVKPGDDDGCLWLRPPLLNCLLIKHELLARAARVLHELCLLLNLIQLLQHVTCQWLYHHCSSSITWRCLDRILIWLSCLLLCVRVVRWLWVVLGGARWHIAPNLLFVHLKFIMIIINQRIYNLASAESDLEMHES